MGQRSKRFIALVVPAFVVVTVLGGCGGGRSEDLKVMLECSIATARLTTAREIRRSQQDKTVSLGKPIRAQVILEYEPVGQHTTEDVFDEVGAILKNDHWEWEKQSIPDPGSFRARQPHENFLLVADVLIEPQRNIVSIRLVTVPR